MFDAPLEKDWQHYLQFCQLSIQSLFFKTYQNTITTTPLEFTNSDFIYFFLITDLYSTEGLKFYPPKPSKYFTISQVHFSGKPKLTLKGLFFFHFCFERITTEQFHAYMNEQLSKFAEAHPEPFEMVRFTQVAEETTL